ncbi:peroxiredoxin [Mycobacteroides abscessus]|uniref:peroxiredoxin n=1 Tax=Mycobacteroides abscessus TaxID=36809 RepID=UPI00311AB039
MAETKRLEVGDKAPTFTLLDADGKKVSLSSYKGRKVIIYFYPAAMTPGCTKQACDFRDSLAELNEAGLDVIGISPDKPEKLAKFRERDGVNFPLLSDPDKTTLTAYGGSCTERSSRASSDRRSSWMKRATSRWRSTT